MPASKEKGKTIKVKYIKSAIGYQRKQRVILKTLGLRKLNQVVELPDNPAVRGMIAKVPHLVRVLEEGDDSS